MLILSTGARWASSVLAAAPIDLLDVDVSVPLYARVVLVADPFTLSLGALIRRLVDPDASLAPVAY